MNNNLSSIDRFFERSIKLSHLRLLVMFAELGQLRHVAEQLNVSQPAVSKQLAELEKGVGSKILKRSGNRLVLTAAGELLLKRSRDALFALKNAQHDMQAISGGLKGKLSIGAVATIHHALMPQIILALKQEAPLVSITLQQATSDLLLPQLASGALDLVLCRTVPGEMANGDFACKQLLDDPIVIACSSEHPLAKSTDLKPRDLVQWPWIIPPRSAPSFLALNSWMHEHELSFPDGCIESISMSLNDNLMRRHPFITVMSASCMSSPFLKGKLVSLQLPGLLFLEHIWMIYNRAPESPLVFMAIDCIEKLTLDNKILPSSVNP